MVSLVPSLTETIASLGLADRLIGVTDWCVSPELPGARRVRGTKNPDVPAIIELAPDLVVANEEENRQIDVDRLRAAGIVVYVTAPDSLAEVATSLERLGTLLGVNDAARALADDILGAVASVDAAVAAAVRLRTFCPIWRDPWMAVGTKTIAADLLRCAGFDVVPQLPRYPRVELDSIAELDPDVVLLPDEPYEFGTADAALFDRWRAAVRLVDGAALTWWGVRTPASIGELRQLAASCRDFA